MSFLISTSWDDGHALDMRLAELLDRYELRGTFYVARHYLRPCLSEAQLRDIAQRHEIGAHTLTHPTLTEIPLEQAREEIRGSKAWLEDVLGQPVRCFCYPRGALNVALQAEVVEAGYEGARGVIGYQVQAGPRYAMTTSLQVYPLPLRPLPSIAPWRGWRARLVPLGQALQAQRQHSLPLASLRAWLPWANAWLDYAQAQGGVFHLWGHSWEIDQYGQWTDLEVLLRRLQTSGGQAVVNYDLLERAS
jgi:peptidoglycan/xylan/chitin deacetylase (PgdA/CDA1 family)